MTDTWRDRPLRYNSSRCIESPKFGFPKPNKVLYLIAIHHPVALMIDAASKL